MITRYTIAKLVAREIPTTADRYTQIAAIQKELVFHGKEILATDREYIDDVLDILFDAFGYQA